jgi:hypothetical protein
MTAPNGSNIIVENLVLFFLLLFILLVIRIYNPMS